MSLSAQSNMESANMATDDLATSPRAAFNSDREVIVMHDWVLLLVSATLGAFAGGIASVGTAARIAQASETGRRREDARQAMLAEVRLYRASFAAAQGLLASKESRLKPDPMSSETAGEFAEQLERQLVDAPIKLTAKVRAHLATLIGATDAAIAAEIAFLPADRRPYQWRPDAFLRIAGLVPDEVKLSKGLVGRVQKFEPSPQDFNAVLNRLDALERDLVDAERRAFGRQR